MRELGPDYQPTPRFGLSFKEAMARREPLIPKRTVVLLAFSGLSLLIAIVYGFYVTQVKWGSLADVPKRTCYNGQVYLRWPEGVVRQSDDDNKPVKCTSTSKAKPVKLISA